jgi:N-acetylglucosaminyldiphosphoundecaprenol N-acetyl-beta-D-mannosaminyltransferase
MRRDRRRVSVTGVEVDNLSVDETVAEIRALTKEPGFHYMAVVNAAKMVATRKDLSLKRILDSADIVTADGMSIVWASWLLGRPLRERVTGIDMLARLLQLATAEGLSVFFLGSKQEVVAAAVQEYRAAYPRLQVAGHRNGYFSEHESKTVAQEIKLTGADLLFVGMGSPAQEKWIAQHGAASGVRFAMGVGGSFDHVTGAVPRAPLWMQRAGLEWLHRLIREPRRMWRRYLIGNTRFIYLVLVQRLLRK